MDFSMTAHTHTHTTACYRKKRTRCRVCALGITAFLICLLLPAQAAAQTDIRVTTHTRTIVQGESTTIELDAEGRNTRNLNLGFEANLLDKTVPVALSNGGTLDRIITFFVTSYVLTVRTYKNRNISIVPRRQGRPAAVEIHEDTPFTVKIEATDPNLVTLNGKNSITLPFIIEHVPGTIRLKIRVYLEGTLRQGASF